MLKVFVLMLVSTSAVAHEVTPTVADITIASDSVSLQLAVNAEAFLADIDLNGLEDTDDAQNAPAYDELRALDAAALQDAVTNSFDRVLAPRLNVMQGGVAVPLTLESVSVEDVSDLELPRLTTLIATGALAGDGPVTFQMAPSFGDMVLRQQGATDVGFAGLLRAGEASPELTQEGGESENGWQTFVRFIPVGIEHIVPLGLDHILFVLGLFFLAARLKPLLWQVSAFTLAHTVTLALGATGVVPVNPDIVEPLIALSIVYVAVENIFTQNVQKWRPALIFAFGLLHGLGFSIVLEEYGIPDGQFLPALIGFNIGVEFGQLIVIGIAFALVGYWFRDKPWYRPLIAIPASAAIAFVGGYWVLERTGMLGLISGA